MKDIIKKDWYILLVILSPFAFVLPTWNIFPDTIATQFDAGGNPIGYSSKAFALLLVPAVNLIIYPILLVLPRIDPRKRNYEMFNDKYRIIRVVLHTFYTLVFGLLCAYALGYKFDMGMIIIYAVLLLFLILGNYLGNIRSNYFIGIRTPWTLSNEEVWRKTHRFTAKLWVAVSLIAMIIYPVVPKHAATVVVFMMVMALVPVIYSYVIWKKVGAPENGKA
jgi:uncharacterized membrane protein